MSKLQDELAWLNHRLDHQLEVWRELHRLHGRISYVLINLTLVLAPVFLFLLQSMQDKPQPPALSQAGASLSNHMFSVAILMLFLLFVLNSLKWKLYGRLLKDGHDLKSDIYNEYVSEKPTSAQSLQNFQSKLQDGLRMERRFPWPMNCKWPFPWPMNCKWPFGGKQDQDATSRPK
jgi:hypothetical protein